METITDSFGAFFVIIWNGLAMVCVGPIIVNVTMKSKNSFNLRPILDMTDGIYISARGARCSIL